MGWIQLAARLQTLFEAGCTTNDLAAVLRSCAGKQGKRRGRYRNSTLTGTRRRDIHADMAFWISLCPSAWFLWCVLQVEPLAWASIHDTFAPFRGSIDVCLEKDWRRLRVLNTPFHLAARAFVQFMYGYSLCGPLSLSPVPWTKVVPGKVLQTWFTGTSTPVEEQRALLQKHNM